MRQSELQFRQNDYSPRFPTSQPPLTSEIEQRIVTLYTSGTGVDAIAREIGRARYRVVHVLQSNGVFGISQPGIPEPVSEAHSPEPREESPHAEEPVRETVVEKPARKPPRRSKASRETAATPAPAHPVAEKPSDRWSPPVVDALCKIAIQSNLYPGKSADKVRRMISDLNR